MKTKMLIVGIVLAALLVTVSSVSAAEIWTDKEDYAPEEIVNISGDGFTPDATIQITVTRPDGETDVCPVSPPAGSGTCGELKNADEDGSFFNYAYKLDGIEGNYTVSASDAGGHTATTTFTDYVKDCWVVYPNGGEIVSGTIDVQFSVDTGGLTNSGIISVYYSNTGCTPGLSGWNLIDNKFVQGDGVYTVSWDTTGDVDGTDYCIGIKDLTFTDSDTSDAAFTVKNIDDEIPEFATIALPAVSILGLFLFFNHRKRKEE